MTWISHFLWVCLLFPLKSRHIWSNYLENEWILVLLNHMKRNWNSNVNNVVAQHVHEHLNNKYHTQKVNESSIDLIDLFYQIKGVLKRLWCMEWICCHNDDIKIAKKRKISWWFRKCYYDSWKTRNFDIIKRNSCNYGLVYSFMFLEKRFYSLEFAP